MRDFFAACAAHAAGAVGFLHLAAEFHFNLLNAAHQSGLDAFGEQRIVGVSVRIEPLHVADQVLQILHHGGVVALGLLLELAQSLERLVVVVGKVLRVYRSAGLTVAVPGSALRIAVPGAAAVIAALLILAAVLGVSTAALLTGRSL